MAAGFIVLPDGRCFSRRWSAPDQVLRAKIVGHEFAVSDDAFALAGSTRADDLDTQLQLLAADVAHPGWRPAAFERMRKAAPTLLDQLDATPAGVLNRDLGQLLHSGDRRWGIPSRAEIAAQTPDDFAVVNFDDPLAVRASAAARSRRDGFSIVQSLATGAWLGGPLMLRLAHQHPESYPADLPWLLGQRHNQANALAALLAARLAGASPAEARAGLLAFRPLAHRMELIAETDGIAYYDDSKGTNVGAVVAALDGFPRPVVLIAGGRDKGGDYAPLAEALGRVGRAAILIGEAADKMQTAFDGVLPIERAATLEAAVEAAHRLARPGDAVVLSPACSSFDMFRDYAHRSEVFRGAVARVTHTGNAR